MTQRELAEGAGIPQPSIARIERGTVLPRTETLIALLATTGHRLTVEPASKAAVDADVLKRNLATPVAKRTRQAGQLGHRSRALRRLLKFGVPFVLIGDLAEVAHGSPMKIGRTVEVCHAQTDVAAERLALVLDEASAKCHLRVVTQTDAGDDYDTLLRNSVRMHVEPGTLVRVAALEDLVRIRRARHTPEDEAAAELLLALLHARGA